MACVRMRTYRYEYRQSLRLVSVPCVQFPSGKGHVYKLRCPMCTLYATVVRTISSNHHNFITFYTMGSQVQNTDIRHILAKKNLQRLATIEPPPKPLVPPPLAVTTPLQDTLAQGDITLEVLQKWSSDNKDTVQKAIKSQVFGGKGDINWANAFFAFMEAAAVYLRDFDKHNKAVQKYRAYNAAQNNQESEEHCNCLQDEALQLYHDSYADIRTLALNWGMDYYPVCDLIAHSPHGHASWDGPYCGAFVTTDAQKERPFIGLAFKGTNPESLTQWHVDFSFKLIASNMQLEKQKVSIGVYTGLFGNFGKENDQDTPYVAILEQLQLIASKLPNVTGEPAKIHVTGHSLGGSYSSLCYAAMMRSDKMYVSELFTVGDEYTFGQPRIGDQGFAKLNRARVRESQGQSWRIVHNKDLVPQVPPVMRSGNGFLCWITSWFTKRDCESTDLDFYHIDNGVHIFDNAKPIALKSEIDELPPPPFITSWFTAIWDVIKGYFDSKDHCKPHPCAIVYGN